MKLCRRTNRNHRVQHNADGGSGVNLRSCETILAHNVLKDGAMERGKKEKEIAMEVPRDPCLRQEQRGAAAPDPKLSIGFFFFI